MPDIETTQSPWYRVPSWVAVFVGSIIASLVTWGMTTNSQAAVTQANVADIARRTAVLEQTAVTRAEWSQVVAQQSSQLDRIEARLDQIRTQRPAGH